MIKSNSILPLLCSVLIACGQTGNSSKKSNVGDSLSAIKVKVQIKQPLYDTSVIAILQIDTTSTWLFKDATSVGLENQDLQTIDTLLNDCIKNHNIKQDTTKEFSEYIDLQKYKRQYIPFINSKGEKKVYVNCFCISNWTFEYWKKDLIQVDDGGSCFFQMIINLTSHKFENFITNGYG